ncbi:MAG TPA: protein kinase [Thermoanaerobaculia bacterium]|nr:protein kinase [Thermoanaerobaculia bacterium]
MSLAAGTRLGPYEILSPLGAGGMGEVWKARDTRLERMVAVKILPSQMSASPEARQRFEREAKTISQLSHPHICALYDVGNQDGVEYLVMELLEGETLAARLAKGALPLEQTFKFGVEIADALDKAHRQGVVHRDLKPGNVMLTKTGVKLLDFGLARLRAEGPLSGLSASVLPTQAPPLTAEGTILGTLQYMAPEQLEGKETDARTDIFAFGALLYEMATGLKAFSGGSQASLVGAILRDDPVSISTISPMSPPALNRLVKTCLAKDPEDRFQTAHDVRLQLQWIAEGGSQVGLPAPVAARRKSRELVAWIAAALLGLGLAVTLPLLLRQRTRAAAPGHALKFSILPPGKTVFQPGMFALSPDGGLLAFVASDPDEKTLLWIRSLDSLEARPLPGTERAFSPFWSPDGRFLAFFAEGKLKKIEASGGPPQTLCDARLGRGGTWNREGIIVFSPAPTDGLYRVSSAGGQASPLTSLDRSRGENSHRWPFFLPDGRHFLYFVRSAQVENRAVCVGSLDSKETKRLMSASASSNALFAPSGHALFERDGWLVARKLDLRRLAFEGEPVPVAANVKGSDPLRAGSFTVSETGVLAYGTGAASDLTQQLTWVDRKGKPLGTIGAPGLYLNFSLSPDEKRLALDLVNLDVGGREIWLMELARGIASRMTLGGASEIAPVWSPDGSRIAFSSPQGTAGADLYQRPTSGAGNAEPLLTSDRTKTPTDWSRDGRFLLFEARGAVTGTDLWVLPLIGDRKPSPVLQMPFNESQGSFSPDGRWIAYVSDESSRPEVYVQPFPVTAAKWRISTDGGSQPRWRGDGKEIFYLAPEGRLMAVAVTAGSAFEAAGTEALFRTGTAFADAGGESIQYAAASNGQRFLINVPVGGTSAQPITVVIDWTADLKK